MSLAMVALGETKTICDFTGKDEMKRHFSHQRAENSRLQIQISQLKTEKTVLQNQLIALQRRISDLEMQVGNDDVKYA